MGLLRNLSAAQIVEQLVEARRFLAEMGEDSTAGNIVLMGMGMFYDLLARSRAFAFSLVSELCIEATRHASQ